MAQRMEHPENDLHSDADFANRPRPEPQSFDDLADGPDPKVEAERNQQSTRQAITFAVAVPLLTLVTAAMLGVVARVVGGPLCESGQATWICSRSAEIWWPIATSVIPVFGMVGCGFILWHKYASYIRWRPWMGAFWVLVPWAMFWMTTSFQMMIVGH